MTVNEVGRPKHELLFTRRKAGKGEGTWIILCRVKPLHLRITSICFCSKCLKLKLLFLSVHVCINSKNKSPFRMKNSAELKTRNSLKM